MSEVTDIVNAWLKESKLNSHYEINEHSDMIECKFYHSSGVNRIRIVDSSIYYWELNREGFTKITLEMADPKFFVKLEKLLLTQCANRRKKVYRQL